MRERSFDYVVTFIFYTYDEWNSQETKKKTEEMSAFEISDQLLTIFLMLTSWLKVVINYRKGK